MSTGNAYKETLNYLYEQLPMFSRLGKDAIKKDITNTVKLCAAINNPQENFKSIHIAGTNGKGSTSHMLAAILQEAGYKVGLYTSPHLVDFRERIRINGVPVSQQWVVDFVANNKAIIEDVQPSFFEITVAMAFQAFSDEQVDIAVIETGLGGRLDSTNIITPVLSIITNISYDHKDILGNTLPEIAREKAGIIKERVPVLIGEQQEEIANVFFETAVLKHSTVYYAEAFWDLVRIKQDGLYQHYKAILKARREMYDLHTDLLGKYQQHNIRTVLAAVQLLVVAQGMNIPLVTALNALSKVKATTGLRGRWEVLNSTPLVVADVAHNPAGLSQVAAQWALANGKRKHIVVGFVKDKDVKEALSFLPKNNQYHFCNADVPRALRASELNELARECGLNGTAYSSVQEAVMTAKNLLSAEDALLVTGSFFIVGEAIEALESLPAKSRVV